jgi:hypothetical protein
MPHDVQSPHHRDLDQLSIHSNEGSNTDSGRGPSEEGDKRLIDGHHGNTLSPNARSTHSSMGQYSTPTSYGYYPHLKAHAAAHSYSANPPQKLRSFAPEESSTCTTPTEPDFDGSPAANTHSNTYPHPARVLPAHGNGGYASRAELQNTYNAHANQNGGIHGNGAVRNNEDHNANNAPMLPRELPPKGAPGKGLMV